MDNSPSITTTTNKPKVRGGNNNTKKRGRETTTAATGEDHNIKKRCQNHRGTPTTTFAESYVEFASSFLFDKLTKRLGNYHQLPLEHMSALAYLKSPVRKPSILEHWNPLEIACFEAGMAVHGKEFNTLSQHVIPTKTTKQIIDFYYIWKKTSHYQKWKKEFVPAEFLVDHAVSTTTARTPAAPASAADMASFSTNEYQDAKGDNDDEHADDDEDDEREDAYKSAAEDMMMMEETKNNDEMISSGTTTVRVIVADDSACFVCLSSNFSPSIAFHQMKNNSPI
jgi:hypothetical protein